MRVSPASATLARYWSLLQRTVKYGNLQNLVKQRYEEWKSSPIRREEGGREGEGGDLGGLRSGPGSQNTTTSWLLINHAKGRHSSRKYLMMQRLKKMHDRQNHRISSSLPANYLNTLFPFPTGPSPLIPPLAHHARIPIVAETNLERSLRCSSYQFPRVRAIDQPNGKPLRRRPNVAREPPSFILQAQGLRNVLGSHRSPIPVSLDISFPPRQRHISVLQSSIH